MILSTHHAADGELSFATDVRDGLSLAFSREIMFDLVSLSDASLEHLLETTGLDLAAEGIRVVSLAPGSTRQWALHDLAAQRENLPLHRYLNPASSPSVELYASTGIGLRNIRERVEHLAGDFSLQSIPGRTVLRVSLPLEREALL